LGLHQGSPDSVLLFQLFIDDIPIVHTDLFVMDHCGFFATEYSLIEDEPSLQNSLVEIEP
jgi:hypothetical protein